MRHAQRGFCLPHLLRRGGIQRSVLLLSAIASMLALASPIRSVSGAATSPPTLNAYALFRSPESHPLDGDAWFATENGNCHIDADFREGFFDNDFTRYTFKIRNQDLTGSFKLLLHTGPQALLSADVPSMTCDQFVGKTFTIDYKPASTITNIGSATIKAE